jgi:pilus assembly protein CpaB
VVGDGRDRANSSSRLAEAATSIQWVQLFAGDRAMKSKSLMLFAVATACGLIAMVGAQQLLSSQGQGAPKIRVLVALGEVDPGVKLTADLVAFREVPQDAVPEGAVTADEQYAERALKVRAFRGSIIQVAQLGEKGQFGTSLDIPEGFRLSSIPSTDTMTHSGIMQPGDRVDVVLTYKQNKRSKTGITEQVTQTKTILEYIQVYAIGNTRMGNEENESKGPAKDAKNVSLLVTPTQAEIIQLAKNKGELQLTLRGILDKKLVASKGTDEAQLEYLRGELADDNGEQEDSTAKTVTVPKEDEAEPKPSFAEFVQTEPAEPVAPPPAPEVPKWKIEVFRGDERKVYEIDDPDQLPSTTTTDATGNSPPQVTSKPGLWDSPLTRWMTGGNKGSAPKPATNTLAQ